MHNVTVLRSYGNVAAGGEHVGFWFETPKKRQYLDLGAFDDNEAHSIEFFGFTSYPPGWQPAHQAPIRNIKIYRNPRVGMFLHNTRLLTFIGGVVSDNGNPAVFVLQGDNITFNGTNIIGRSSIKIARSPQCNHGPVGMILHPTKSQESDLTGTVTGTTLIDVEFINFSQELTDECPQGQPTFA